MITSLIVTAILVFAGLFLFWQIYSGLENETNKMITLVSYLLFVLILILYWFIRHLNELMEM